MRIII